MINKDFNLINNMAYIYNQSEILNAIAGAKKLIDAHVKNGDFKYGKFEGYQHVYFNTNEKISSYLDLVDMNNYKNALSVTASGDHAFNLITKGILDIDTFDVNILTEYFVLGLKRAMVLKYSYTEYRNILHIMRNKHERYIINEIIIGLLPYMDEKYRTFWKEIVDYDYKIQKEAGANKDLITMLFTGLSHNFITIVFNNNYLKNEECYNKLRNNLGKANITFNAVDAYNLPEFFKDKEYDLILLSNILDYFHRKWGYYWKYDNLENYLNKIEKIMKEDGIIFLHYMFIYYNYLPNHTYEKTNRIIESSDIKYEDINDLEIHPLYEPTNSYELDSSGIILKRQNLK